MLISNRLATRILLGIIVLFLTITSPVSAQDEFTINQEVDYQITSQGNALVSHQVNMVNNFSSIYATQYNLGLSGSKLVKNITATSDNFQLKTKVDRANRNFTQIIVFFDPPITGKDRTNQFTIKYQLDNFVENIGQTKRITIPKINNIDSLDEIKLTIRVPKVFGPPSFVSPKNFQEIINNEEIIISFGQADLFDKEVMAIFGDVQSMQFNLKYFLENLGSQETEKIISLPPDTSYQKVFLTDIEPQPEKITTDKDGNWLAYYTLDPEEELTIEARGVVQITAEPQNPPLIPIDFSIYLEKDHYWETDDQQIKDLARELKTVKQIYRYVVDNLEYNLDRVKNKEITRRGALGAIENPDQVICTEFTDLFIALARAAGIPAREINGYAYSTNPQMLPASLYADILHSWPEYWDDLTNTWRQIDPTWESTSNIDYFNKMDMAHFAFVIHGQSSQFPLPAGAYQKQSQHQKSINIAFGQPPIDLTIRELDITWDLAEEISIGKNILGEMIITNPNNQALYQIKVNLIGEGVGAEPKKTTIEVLPPFSQIKVPLTVYNQSFWGHPNSQITAKITTNYFAMEKTLPLKSLSILNWQALTNYWYILLPTIVILTVTGLLIKSLFRGH